MSVHEGAASEGPVCGGFVFFDVVGGSSWPCMGGSSASGVGELASGLDCDSVPESANSTEHLSNLNFRSAVSGWVGFCLIV